MGDQSGRESREVGKGGKGTPGETKIEFLEKNFRRISKNKREPLWIRQQQRRQVGIMANGQSSKRSIPRALTLIAVCAVETEAPSTKTLMRKGSNR